ncbi:MAG: hypothetical protein QNJ45_13365 [Ardenticatenaceae bacterium]|nr:hypothetical protein [Ardenticatenaceae bacterium]
MKSNPLENRQSKIAILYLVLLLAVGLAVLAVFLWRSLAFTGGQVGVPLDDTWIHLVFARNIAQGQGFSFNPGEPTPGSTAPLWTLLLALGIPFSASADFMIPFAIALSALFFIGCLWLAYAWTVDLTGRPLLGFAAGAAVALTGRFVWAGLSGMEITLFALLTMSGIWQMQKKGLTVLAAILFGLASQVRPEGHLLWVLGVGCWVIGDGRWVLGDGWRVIGDRLKALFWPAVVYVLIALPYVLFCLSVTQNPLPNTFYAKASTDGGYSVRFLVETLRLQWFDNPISLLLVPVGLWATWRRTPLMTLWFIGLPLAMAATVDGVWHHGRYILPTLPLQMILAAAGADFLIRRMVDVEGRAPLPRRLLIGLLALVLALGGSWRLPSWADMLAANTNEILEIDVALGQWLAVNTPADAVLAVDDIGAIGYLSNRRIVDSNGLVSPQLWPAVRQPEKLRRNQTLARLLALEPQPPDYTVAFVLWRWEIITNPIIAEEVHRVETGTHTIILQPDAFVHRVTWPYVMDDGWQVMGDGNDDEVIRVESEYGEVIRLEGVRMGRPDALTVEVDLFWRSLETVNVDYDVFVHVIDEAGEIIAQADGQPVAGLAATSIWRPGDLVRDPRVIQLPDTNFYALRIGLYNRKTGERLQVGGGEFVEIIINNQ